MSTQSQRQRASRSCFILLGSLLLGGSHAGQATAAESGIVLAAGTSGGTGRAAIQPKELRMWMKVGDRRFAVTLADNAAGRAFAERLPLSLQMEELNGNEKHARLPAPLPADASRPGTIRAGDLMLYGSDTLVVFYATFQSQYAYTRIGRVDDPTGLPRALGARDVGVAFSRD